MASTSTRICRAVCFCVVSFASGFLCFFLLFGCSLGGFVLADAAWAFFCCFGCSELAVFCFLVLVVCLASLRPLKKSAVKKKIIPSSTNTPPSSAITLTKKYQVFLSFRGPDTRVGFTSHLYDALSRTCMLTFIDFKLVRGEEISSALLKSIQESKIAVVIFSKDYASSRWCLRELAEIMKRKKLRELIVLPVFYDVDPSDVRKQTGPFKDSFAKHENESPEEVLEWRKAFTEASNLAGWDSAKTRSEAKLVHDIVEDVKRKLMGEIEKISPPLNDVEGRLIGIENRIKPVMSLLSRPGTMGVQIIGIWGMGGIGKTTLVEYVFHRISSQFDGSCFIEVGERLENRESNCLRHEVLSKVLHEVNMELPTPTILPPFIKQRLTQKKVLIVFDDVNKFRLPLETLVNDLIRCGLGSRIIITSRDKHVLYNYNVLDCNIYEVEGLNFYEALMLFSNYAFNQNHPTEDFMYLSVRMVRYAKDNPLALRVLGSHLLGKDKQEWESAFDDLQGIGDFEIFNILKISYDVLNNEEKNLFLDIACFFNGYFKDDIAKLLDCKYSLSVLIDKSLVTIKGGGIYMHDLLRDMGREIVRRESPKNPGKRSRLWKHDDVIRTLRNNNGTEEVEGISLHMDSLKDVHLSLSCRVFDKMPNLRLLLFTCHRLESNKVHLSDGRLNSLPNDLIILEWHRYPLRALPSDFSLEKLVKLDLSNSNIEQLWEGTKHAPKLKRLILRYCQHLTRIPNLSGFLSLEHLDLTGCNSLVEFPSFVQQLNKLRYLSLDGCSNVTKFPLTSKSIERLNLRNTAIEEVPTSIHSLTNLTELDLSRCLRIKHIPASIFKLKSLHTLNLDDCKNLETFLEISETTEILNSLELSGTAITELSSSIKHLNGLQCLKLRNCKNLEMLPSGICDLTSLEELNLCNFSKLEKLPEKLGNLKSLKHLNVSRSAVGQIPSSITCLENLLSLDCYGCRGLTILPPLSGLRSLSKLDLEKCNLIEIPEDIGCLSSLKCLDLCGNMFESLPKSIKHLSKLKTLLLRDCNMLRSLTELPVALQKLDAINCKQLCQALPDASEFKCCITSKDRKCCNTGSRWECDEHFNEPDYEHFNEPDYEPDYEHFNEPDYEHFNEPDYEHAKFLFINCFNLDQKAVSNVFEESVEGSEEPPTQFSIYLPGNKIPEWFTYQSRGSSIYIQVLRQDLVNRKFMGFAICAVLGTGEYHYYHGVLGVHIYCVFKTCDGHRYFSKSLDFSADRAFIDSDHILLGYSSFSEFLSPSQNLEMLYDSECDFSVDSECDYVDISVDSECDFSVDSECDYVDISVDSERDFEGISVEFNNKSKDFNVKYCAVHPIYAEPKEIIGATIKDIRETSGRRSG